MDNVIQFIKNQILPAKWAQLIIKTVMKWQQDNCAEMGAALAYYALFSLFPLLIIILSIFGSILGTNDDAYLQLIRIAQDSLPEEAYLIVRNTLLDLNRSSLGAGLVGFGLLLFTASRIFDVLDRSVDKIWHAASPKRENQGMIHLVKDFVSGKILAFALILGTSALLFISLISNIAVRVILEILKRFEEAVNWFNVDLVLLVRGLQTGITFFLLTAVVMSLYKILPTIKIKWGDIWLGSMIAVGLYMLLQKLVGSGIVGIGEQFRAYGVLGGVMVLMLWIYLTFQIFFLGCEFTYVYAHLFGSRQDEEL